MKCPHCGIAIHEPKERLLLKDANGSDITAVGYSEDKNYLMEYKAFSCPECGKFIVKLYLMTFAGRSNDLSEVVEEVIGYPNLPFENMLLRVANDYQTDYIEAKHALSVSEKASAVLSRQAIRKIVRSKTSYDQHNLYQGLENLAGEGCLPSDLSELLQFGSRWSNKVDEAIESQVDYDAMTPSPGEAQWLLSVFEALIEYYFIRPKLNETRIKRTESSIEYKEKCEDY